MITTNHIANTIKMTREEYEIRLKSNEASKIIIREFIEVNTYLYYFHSVVQSNISQAMKGIKLGKTWRCDRNVPSINQSWLFSTKPILSVVPKMINRSCLPRTTKIPGRDKAKPRSKMRRLNF